MYIYIYKLNPREGSCIVHAWELEGLEPRFQLTGQGSFCTAEGKKSRKESWLQAEGWISHSTFLKTRSKIVLFLGSGVRGWASASIQCLLPRSSWEKPVVENLVAGNFTQAVWTLSPLSPQAEVGSGQEASGPSQPGLVHQGQHCPKRKNRLEGWWGVDSRSGGCKKESTSDQHHPSL